MKSNYPYHYHAANTEVFYIISGQGILRTPNGNRSIKAGDYIVCPPSENGAHKIINNSSSEILKYIDFDTTNSPDIISYPDSDKTGIIIHNESSMFSDINNARSIFVIANSKIGDTMKTLIFNGSPRREGDTISLINKVIENLNGELVLRLLNSCRIIISTGIKLH